MAVPPSLATLMEKIKAVHTVNNEIIARIQSAKPAVSGYNYTVGAQIAANRPEFTLTVQPRRKEPSNIIWEWRVPEGNPLTAIRDIFNDRLDYKPTTFDAVKGLNARMFEVCEKYLLLREEAALIELRRFLTNFECLQVALGDLEGRMQNVESVEAQIRRHLGEINKQLAAIAALERSDVHTVEYAWGSLRKKHTYGY